MLCLTGDWFASTYALQSLTLCCGPKLRRLPPHDGIAPQRGSEGAHDGHDSTLNRTESGEGVQIQTSRSDDFSPPGSARPPSSSPSGRRASLPPLNSPSSSPSFSSNGRRVSFSPQIRPEEAAADEPPQLELAINRRLSFREAQLQLRQERGF